MTTDALRELEERLMRATEGSRSLNHAIQMVVGSEPVMVYGEWMPPSYTTSIDAALTLVPEGCQWAKFRDGQVLVSNGLMIDAKATCATVPLSLCLANVRARLSSPSKE